MQFNNKKIATSLFILANLYFAFLFTSAFGYGLSITYSLATFLLLMTLRNKALYFSVCITSAIAAFLYCPVGLTFGPPDLNSLTSLAYTDQSESIEFLLNIGIWKWLISLSIILSAVSCLIFKTAVTFTLPGLMSLLSFIVFFSTPIKAAYTDNHSSLMQSHYPPIRFVNDAYEAYNQVNADKVFYEHNVSKTDDWNPVQHNDKYDTVVVVVGESVRRDFMSAYGFPIENTPFMNSAPGLLYTNYVSSGPATVLSLTHTLYRTSNGAVEYNNSIVRLMSKSGYHTNWISNQGVYGGADSPVSLAGKQADEYHFIKNGASNKLLYSPDEKMLPLITDAISMKGKKAIFIHLMGSHPMACVRTDGLYSTFFRSHEESCYVQSIQNTDSLLASIYETLGKTHDKWAMVYFADHGLMAVDRDSADERLNHADKYKSDYNVPLFITTYDAHNRKEIDAPRSGFSFISLLSGLVGINDALINTSCDLLSNEDCTPDRTVIKKDGSLVPYASLPDEKPLY